MCLYSDVVSIDDDDQPDAQSDDRSAQQPDDEPVAGPSTEQYVHTVYQTPLSRYISICINRVTDGLIAELGVAVVDADSDQESVASTVSSSLAYVQRACRIGGVCSHMHSRLQTVVCSRLLCRPRHVEAHGARPKPGLIVAHVCLMVKQVGRIAGRCNHISFHLQSAARRHCHNRCADSGHGGNGEVCEYIYVLYLTKTIIKSPLLFAASSSSQHFRHGAVTCYP